MRRSSWKMILQKTCAGKWWGKEREETSDRLQQRSSHDSGARTRERGESEAPSKSERDARRSPGIPVERGRERQNNEKLLGIRTMYTSPQKAARQKQQRSILGSSSNEGQQQSTNWSQEQKRYSAGHTSIAGNNHPDQQPGGRAGR